MREPLRWEYAGAWLLGAVLCSEAVRRILDREPPLPDEKLWASLAGQGVWVCIALALASLPRSGSVAGRLGLGPGRLRTSSVVLLALGLLALSGGLSALLVALQLHDLGTLGEARRLVAATRGPSVLLALLSVGVAPGIAEEILFRGLVQRGITRHLGRLAGLGVGAALFAVAHADPIQSSAALLLGLYLGVVADLDASVRAAIACHVVNNLAATIAARLGGVPVPDEPLVAALLMVGAGAFLLLRVWRRERPSRDAPRGAERPAAPHP